LDSPDQVAPHALRIDKTLSVQYLYDASTAVIVGNSHTWRGRFEILLETGVSISASISEVTPLTEEAKYWLLGFISGYEPHPWDVLGSGWLDDTSDAAMAPWRDAVLKFRQSGFEIHDNREA
jgi:hypothetical protein